MAVPAIDVRELSKTYAVPVREGGLAAALKSLVQRQTRQVEAVKQISFEVAPGEIVGFLGPKWRGQDHQPQDAFGPPVPLRWARAGPRF